MNRASLIYACLILGKSAAWADGGFALRCPDMTIRKVSEHTIELREDGGLKTMLSRQFEGDCRDHQGLICYQEGQLMVNISPPLALGQAQRGTVWINLDTDDRPEHHGLGDRVECVKVDTSAIKM